MRTMSVFFYCLCAGLSPITFGNSLKAATLEFGSQDFSMDFFWTKDQEKLYFNFDIPEGMLLGDEYTLIEKDRIQGCEFILTGENGSSSLIKLRVSVENILQAEKVFCEVESKIDSVDEGIERSQTFSHKGIIKSLQIDLKKEPKFRIKFKDLRHGIIEFNRM